jgi:hypothetical protein
LPSDTSRTTRVVSMVRSRALSVWANWPRSVSSEDFTNSRASIEAEK